MCDTDRSPVNVLAQKLYPAHELLHWVTASTRPPRASTAEALPDSPDLLWAKTLPVATHSTLLPICNHLNKHFKSGQ